MMPRSLGPLLIIVGAGVAVLGAALWLGALDWFGRLPGDVRIEHASARVYVPIVSMLIVSALLSLVLWIARKLF
jgi:hypothetical protein